MSTVDAEGFDRQLSAQTTTLLFADVVESVRLFAADERAAIARLAPLLVDLTQLCTDTFDARLIERRGDALLLRFDHARSAVRAALAIHRRASQPSGCAIHFRIGLHVCEVYETPEGLYGQGLNATARIAGLANPGETVASAIVRDRIVADIDADIEDLGECYVKHFDASFRVFRLREPGAVPPTRRRQPQDLRPAIAVVPPQLRSESHDDGMTGQILADCVIAALSRLPDFRVLARLSTQAVAGVASEPVAAARLLGADYILLGEGRADAGRLSIELKLVERETHAVVFVEPLQGRADELLVSDSPLVTGVADLLARAVLNLQVRRAQNARMPTLKSYGLLLAGIGLLHRQQFRDFDRARELFEALADRHPRHATPYAWLAAWRVFRVTQGWFDDLDKEVRIGADLARRAVDIDADDALSQTVSGLVHTNLKRDFDSAQRSFETALHHNPSEPLAWLHRGALQAFVGDPGQALNDTGMARSLSPLDPWRYYFDSLSASAAFAAGDNELAVELGERSLRANCLHLSTLRVLAMAYAELGQHQRASECLQSVLSIDPALTVRTYLSRSPAAGRRMAEVCASALRKAGLPE